MEVKTKKHDNLSQSVNIVLQLEPICIGRGANHITVNCLLASIHMVQLESKLCTKCLEATKQPLPQQISFRFEQASKLLMIGSVISDEGQFDKNSSIREEGILVKYIIKIETVIQNQLATIQSFKNQVGQIQLHCQTDNWVPCPATWKRTHESMRQQFKP